MWGGPPVARGGFVAAACDEDQAPPQARPGDEAAQRKVVLASVGCGVFAAAAFVIVASAGSLQQHRAAGSQSLRTNGVVLDQTHRVRRQLTPESFDGVPDDSDVGPRPVPLGMSAAWGRHPSRKRVPEMYGKVPEKTIWAYWYDPDNCPSSVSCALPPHLELCAETVRRNKGGFQYRLLRRDEVFHYVSSVELPRRWMDMSSQLQKDSLMNALLARYGGVALDLSTVLLRPLDVYWDEMVNQGATFRGYLYRANGEAWGGVESMAVWFLMSRREGIFTTAVRDQVIGMGSEKDSFRYAEPYRALGDQTLTPIIAMYNSSWPKCGDDVWVNDKDKCPEKNLASGPHEFAPEDSPRSDVKLMLEEPREGPQLPFCFEDGFGMGAWDVSDDSEVSADQCKTRRECWKFFLSRFNQGGDEEGSPPLLFVKLFNAGGPLKVWSLKELLSKRNTFFYHWLEMAGVTSVDSVV